MIAYLKGKLVLKEPTHILLDVGGIGYHVNISLSTYSHLKDNSRDAARRTFTEAKADNQIGPRPTLWIDWIEWEGPHHDIWPPEAAQSLLPEKPKEQKEGAYAREVLTHFARTAFRIKEPSDSLIEKLVGI
ncbi:MAG: OB-fold domain-containing protein, partial [Bacteroidota bacterium]